MGVGRTAGPVDIAVSGLMAQNLRLKVISRNIANAQTTRTPTGGPYRRQVVALSAKEGGLDGVTVGSVADDLSTDFRHVRMPAHPDADADGFVKMPNVSVPAEIMNLVAASRAYQANAAVLKRYQDVVSVTLELLR